MSQVYCLKFNSSRWNEIRPQPRTEETQKVLIKLKLTCLGDRCSTGEKRLVTNNSAQPLFFSPIFFFFFSSVTASEFLRQLSKKADRVLWANTWVYSWNWWKTKVYRPRPSGKNEKKSFKSALFAKLSSWTSAIRHKLQTTSPIFPKRSTVNTAIGRDAAWNGV